LSRLCLLIGTGICFSITAPVFSVYGRLALMQYLHFLLPCVGYVGTNSRCFQVMSVSRSGSVAYRDVGNEREQERKRCDRISRNW